MTGYVDADDVARTLRLGGAALRVSAARGVTVVLTELGTARQEQAHPTAESAHLQLTQVPPGTRAALATSGHADHDGRRTPVMVAHLRFATAPLTMIVAIPTSPPSSPLLWSDDMLTWGPLSEVDAADLEAL